MFPFERNMSHSYKKNSKTDASQIISRNQVFLAKIPKLIFLDRRIEDPLTD